MSTAANLNLVVAPLPRSSAHTTNGSISNSAANNIAQKSKTSATNTTTVSSSNQTTNTTITTTTNSGSLSDSLASGTTEGQRTPSSTNHNEGHLSRTNLYIKGLQAQTTDDDLYNMCSRFGHISSTKAILDKTTRSCRGYGFVEFSNPQSAKMAVQELTKSGVQAQMAKLSPLYSSNQNNHHQQHHHNQHHHHHHHRHNNHNNSSNNNGSGGSHNSSNIGNNNSLQHNQNSLNNNNNADPTNLYIANLPPNMSEQELENLLSTYGPVVSTRILRDQSNIPRGVGFARMESRDKCEQIIEQLNGRPCKGWKEPLLVKFADGGNKKRHHHNFQHLHQNSSNHHQHHKAHPEDNRWRDSSASEIGSVSSFDHQGNISHSNHLSDLAMMSTMSFPRMQPGFPPTVTSGAYPSPLGPPTSATQWIHPSAQYVIPQQMIQSGAMGPANQTALHYGHIPQLTSQMQGLQIAHPGAPVGGYLPPQHQWPAVWPHPMAQQPQPSLRMQPASIQPLPPSQQSLSPQSTPVLQQQQQQQQQSQQPPVAQQSIETADCKFQISMPL